MKKLYYGAKFLTLSDNGYAEAMLVDGDKIAAIGSYEDVARVSGECEHEDLGGVTVMPGFIDAHGHFPNVAADFAHASFRGVRSIEEMKERIAAHIKNNAVPDGSWIVAKGYDENLLPGHAHPSIAELDDMSPDNPLYVSHTSGHAGLYNSAALKLLGVDDDTPSPDGNIVKKNGKLTGYMLEGANSRLCAKIPPVSNEILARNCIKAQEKYASYGITTVQDGYATKRIFSILNDLSKQGLLKLDVIGYAPAKFYTEVARWFSEQDMAKNIRLGGIKSFIDGSPQLRTAFLRTPYLNSDDCGSPVRTYESLVDVMRLSSQSRAQAIIHSNGDMAIEWFLNALEEVSAEDPSVKELRPVIIHGQLMGLDQLPRAKELGAIVSFFVAHTYHFADAHIRNLGIDRARLISPTRSALKEGVIFTFHQDPPVIEQDMFETVWCAANRITRDGVSLSGEEIDVIDAIRAVTVSAAYQYGEEDIKGSLETGKLADFIVIDRDPLEIPKEELRDVKILRTYKNGELIFNA